MRKISEQDENVIRVEVSGALTQDDYDEMIPSWKAGIARHGKLSRGDFMVGIRLRPGMIFDSI